MIELSVCTLGSSMSKLMVCCGGDRAKVACGCSSGKARSRGAPGTLPLPQCCLVAPTFLLPSYLHPPQRSTPPDPPQSTEHCDWLYGIFGHETSCTRYWTCWNGENPEKSIKPNFVQGGILMLHIFTLLSLSRHSNRAVLHWRAPLQRGDPRLRLASECGWLPEAS